MLCAALPLDVRKGFAFPKQEPSLERLRLATAREALPLNKYIMSERHSLSAHQAAKPQRKPMQRRGQTRR
jgi:hypothetical protein